MGIGRAVRILGCVLVLAPAAALGAVEGTHHDMRIYNRFEEKSVCTYCHVPHGAQSEQNLFAMAASTEGLGPVGAFCYLCHDGTVIPTALVTAPDGTVGLEALTRSHGYNIERIDAVTGGLEKAANVLASGLVKVPDPAEPPKTFDCDACHDPHSSQFAPFLRAPLEALCQRCHVGRDGAGKGRWTTVDDVGLANGPHPVGMPFLESGKDNVRGLPSEKPLHGPAGPFAVVVPSLEELKRTDVHWNTGGHLLGVERKVTCSTCHSAHMPDPNLLVARAAKSFAETVCSGCHGKGDNPENPGNSPFYHPVLGSSVLPYIHDHASHPLKGIPNIPDVGTIDLFVTLPSGWPVGSKGELFCTTCHQAHAGREGARVLRKSPKARPMICDDCHGVGEQTPKTNRHHPTGDKNYTDPVYNDFPKTLGWAWGIGLPGDLADGLQCVDCHTELAKSAHNW